MDDKKYIVTIHEDELAINIIKNILEDSEYFNSSYMEFLSTSNVEDGKKLINKYNRSIIVVFTDVIFEENPIQNQSKEIIEYCEELKILSVVISGYLSMETIFECRHIGAWEFIREPFDTDILCSIFSRAIEKYKEDNEKKFEYNRLTDLIIKQAEELNRAYKELQDKNKELNSLYFKGIEIVATVVELNDPYTAGHMSRVALISMLIADKLELAEISDKLYVSAILHDIGKVGIPITLLTRPKELNSQEYELIKTHSKLGYNILKNLNLEIAEIVYQHHEKCDGSGYPRGLKEDDISDTANIIAFADILESLSSFRPYRPAFSKEEVIDYLNKNKCWFKEYIFEVGMNIFINNGFDEITNNIKNILKET